MARRAGFGQQLLWRVETLAYDLVAAVLRVAPIDAASAVGGALLKFVGPLTGVHRTVLRNLRLAFPEWSDAERQRIGRLQWESAGRMFAEFFMMDRILADPARVELPGQDVVDDVMGETRPMIFVSGHISNFEIMASAGLHKSVEGVLLYRGLNNPYIDQRMRSMRLRYGIRLLAPKGAKGGHDVLAALKEGLPVGILADQKYNEGPLIPFFGHPVRTQPAPARWAMRFGARLQTGWVERKKGARFRLLAGPEIPLPTDGGGAEDVNEALRQINAFIESKARARPWEYWWLHRRFPDELYHRLAAEGH
jgi:KDO2-lipid IV(A) lauroyltransferase